ncbi:MAG: MipA/OmpV family protein [Pseudomonadota bacterium]
MPRSKSALIVFAPVAFGLSSAPLYAEETDAAIAREDAQSQQSRPQQGPPTGGPDIRGPAPEGVPDGGRPAGPPPGIPFEKPVFDDTWVTVGIGIGLVPSYTGSDDYTAFPLPLIVGRVGGVGLRPNGPGIALDLLSKAPAGPPSSKPSFNFGPAFRIRNDRVNQIEDAVVERLDDLDLAIEIGLDGGVTFPGVFTRGDRLSLGAQARFDVAGAHDGFVVEPSIGYARPFGTGTLVNFSLGAQIVDDNFAEYYFNLSPADALVTGLPVFGADGSLNSLSATAIITNDLDGNALNGGFSIYTIAGYTRLVGDAANTPFTDIRGNANQFIAGVGVAYTF